MGDEAKIVVGALGGEPDEALVELLETHGHPVARTAQDGDLLHIIRAGEFQLAVVRATPPLNAGARRLLKDLLEVATSTRLLLMADGEIARVDGREGVLRLPCAATEDEIVSCVNSLFEGRSYQWASDLGLDARKLAQLDFGEQAVSSTQGLRFFLHFARDLSRHASFSKMLDFALEEFLKLFRCQSGSIYLWDAERRELVLRTAAGPQREQRLGHRQRVGEGIAGWVAEVGEALLVTDVRRIKHLEGRDFDRYPTHSCLCAPLKQDDHLLGVVALTMRREGLEFSVRDLELMTSLCQDLFTEVGPINVVSELRRFTEELQAEVSRSRVRVAEKERELRELQTVNQSIVESIPMAMLTYDRDLNVQFCNSQARSMLGTKAGVSSLLPLPKLRMSPEAWREQLMSVLEKGRELRLQRYEYGEAAGKCIVDVRGWPMRDDEGAISSGLLVIEDVTEEVELERKLLRAERLVLLGKLASRVAHELNNPLDGIMRYLNLAIVRLRKDPARAEHYLEESKRGLIRMANIITELLVFSRNQYAQDQLKALDSVIFDSVAMFEQRANTHGVGIEVDIPPQMPMAPSREIDEVFCNLIKNAIDVMPDGGQLCIEGRLDDGTAVITISDTGPGVPEELREKIFEPFVTTKDEGGTGLGLAICRDILARFGGSIRLDTVPAGASFTVTIPLRPERASHG